MNNFAEIISVKQSITNISIFSQPYSILNFENNNIVVACVNNFGSLVTNHCACYIGCIPVNIM